MAFDQFNIRDTVNIIDEFGDRVLNNSSEPVATVEGADKPVVTKSVDKKSHAPLTIVGVMLGLYVLFTRK